MAIEILDYTLNTSGACIGLFSVRFPAWKNFTIRKFRHCKKDNKEWIDLPLEFKKNDDGSWEKPTPNAFFPDAEDNDALKRSILQELNKRPKTQQRDENALPF